MGAFGQGAVPLVIGHSEVAAFGVKIGNVESDVLVNTQRTLFDMKHTIGNDQIESISIDLIERCRDLLASNQASRILIPVNQPPSPTGIERIRGKVPPEDLAKIDFVLMPGNL